MSTTGFRGFDHTIQETNTWLHEIGERMDNPDRHMAYHALRGVLFALRDRLTVEEVFNLAAQLPMLIRGVYFEGYKVAGKPEKYHVEEFLARVAQELHKAGPANPEKATRAVFAVLDQHVTGGEIDDIYGVLPKDLRQLWPPLETVWNEQF
jgi:uncharacterized protein (DUF2267 family)